MRANPPPDEPEPLPPSPVLEGDETGGMLVALGGAGCIAGAFLPWAKANVVFVGEVTASGIDGGDGWLYVIGGLILLVTGLRMRSRSLTKLPLPTTAAVLLALLTLLELGNVDNKLDAVRDTGVATASVGFGLWIIVAALAAVAVGLFRLRTARL